SQLGDFKAAQMQVKARAQASFLNQVVADVRSASANGHAQTLPDAKIDPRLASPANYVEDITALSAIAYLLDLLDYAVAHLQVTSTTTPPTTSAVTLATLRGLFQQPFDTLPVANESMTAPVAQVRLCIEALRGYLQSKPPAPVQQQVLAQAVKAYCLATYTALLTRIGASFDALRAMRDASNDERQALANRLGIDLGTSQPDPLTILLLDPTAAANTPQALTESALETLFGLVNTTRDPFAPGSLPLLQQWQQQHLRTLWAAQDATDRATYPLIDPDQISQADLSASPAGKTALGIWQARRTLVDNMLARLKTFPKTLAGLDALLQGTLNITSSLLKALVDERAQGTDITPDLDRLYLENAAFTYLVRIQDLLHTNAPVPDSEWADVYAIVVEAQKRGLFAQWRKEEQAKGIVLSPDFFQISDAPAPQLPAWLASEETRRTWQDTFQARIDQEH